MNKFDYEHIRNINQEGWQESWLQLLEGRFIVANNELIQDSNAPIFRLGFTVAEVAAAIGHQGYTQRELEWYRSQPDRYTLARTKYHQVDGWAEIWNAKQLREAMDKKLADIDTAVATRLSQPFLFGGANFYPDTEFIQGIYSALPLLPSGYAKRWKTADKQEDGLHNVYVTLDKEQLTGLAMAYLAFKEKTWEDGEALKDMVKSAVSVEDVEKIKVVVA